MTDQLDTALAKAGVDQLRADLTLTVYDGRVDNGAVRPYVLVYPWVGRPEDADSNALDGLSRTLIARWYCHCVGDTREAATAMSQRARTQLLDKLLTVPGFPNLGLTLVKQESAPQPTLDETTGTPVFDAVCVYKVRATT